MSCSASCTSQSTVTTLVLLDYTELQPMHGSRGGAWTANISTNPAIRMQNTHMLMWIGKNVVRVHIPKINGSVESIWKVLQTQSEGSWAFDWTTWGYVRVCTDSSCQRVGTQMAFVQTDQNDSVRVSCLSIVILFLKSTIYIFAARYNNMACIFQVSGTSVVFYESRAVNGIRMLKKKQNLYNLTFRFCRLKC